MKLPASSPVATLTVLFEEKVLSTWEVPHGAVRIIGRGNDVHYQIKSGALSRHHCQIADTEIGLEITDLNSLNGTFVNNAKISKTILHHGDLIQFDKLAIKVELSDPEHGASTSSLEIVAKPDSSPEIPKAAEAEKNEQNVPEPIGSEIEKIEPEAAPSAPTQRSAPVNIANLANLANDGPKPNARQPLWQPQIPSGKCQECGKVLSAQLLASRRGIFKGDQIYCITCFCNGAGNFPTVAGYRIVKKLGGGGMGEVYEAIQLSMERPVAFKLMRGLERASDPQIRRFFREACTGGKLSHPNIVNFIDAGKLEGACFITMELIDGIDLKRLVKEKGPLPYLEAMMIGYHVIAALDYAHARFNIVHRDVKPENILVDTNNVVKLTDFGLAKNLEDAGLSGITQSQTGVGTLFYMSPEQIANARFADHRADIYSLGVSLYEIISGVRPFVADDMMALIRKIRNDQPVPLTYHVSNLPAQVVNIIEKAMSKTVEGRYQSAKEMGEDIQSFLKQVAPHYLML